MSDLLIFGLLQSDPTAINKLKAALANSLNTAQETGEGREPSILTLSIRFISYIYFNTIWELMKAVGPILLSKFLDSLRTWSKASHQHQQTNKCRNREHLNIVLWYF